MPTSTLESTFMTFGDKIAEYLPAILGALFILVVGIVLANVLGGIVRGVADRMGADRLVARLGVEDDLQRMNVSFSLSRFLGGIVKWFLVLMVVIAAADTLSIPQISLFLTDVAFYIPNVIAAVVILGIGFVAGRFVGRLVEGSASASDVTRAWAPALGTTARVAIVVFAALAALVQLGIAERLIEIFFAGFVAMIAIAGGIAFGLGGRDLASDLLRTMRGRMQ